MVEHSGLELRLASPRDAEEIALMSRDLIETGLIWSWTPERVNRAICCADSVVLTVSALHQILGFAIMKYLQDEAHLNLIAVYPQCQRTGIGRRMIRWLEESARIAGTFMVYLEVRSSRPDVHAFYRRLGFRDIGLLAGYYQGRENAMRMVHDLRSR